EIFLCLLALHAGLDAEAALVLVVAAEPDGAGNFRDDRRLLGPPRLEQLRHPRQTAGDVAGLGAFSRHACDDIARLDMAAGIDRQDRVHCQQIAGVAAAGELEDLAVLALDHHGRTQILLAAGGAGAPVDDHALGDASRFVELLLDRLAFHQILEPDSTVDLGEDRAHAEIPLGNALAALDVIALVDLDAGAVLDAVNRALGAGLL